MKIIRTCFVALAVVALVIVVGVPVLMAAALVLLVLARINPVLGFMGLILGLAAYRVATQHKPRWFLE